MSEAKFHSRTVPQAKLLLHIVETLIDARKEVNLEINIEETKYMMLSCHLNAGQNEVIHIANR
jgi:hypothetical protein